METKKEVKTSKNINLSIDIKEIATLVGETCCECYGVIGLTSVNTIKNHLIILKKENYVDGVNVTKERNRFSVDIHLVCAYEVKVTEVVSEVSKRLFYVLTKKYGQLFNKINVYVEEVRDL